MKKHIVEFIRYCTLYDLHEENNLNMTVPRHQLWNWDTLLTDNYLLSEASPEKLSKNRLIRQLFMDNYKQQIKAMKDVNADALYAPFMGDAYFVALLKTLHLYKKPLVAIAQDTWNPLETRSRLNKLKYLFLRYIAKHGVDRLLFISEKLHEQCKDYFDNPKKQQPLLHWGVDFEYYDRHVPLPTHDLGTYIYVTGGSNRDFYLLPKIADMLSNNIHCKIFVQTNKVYDIVPSKKLIVDESPKSWSDLLNGYHNSLAVAVPLLENLSYMSGITVVYEGMACRKPILSTESRHYPFDIEKEKIGFLLPKGDANAWKEAIEYLVLHKDEAIEMGERGRYLVEKNYNYKLFSQEISNHFNSIFDEKR